MKVIGPSNKAELQFFFDTLLEVINEGGTIILPEIVSVNQTGQKYIKKWQHSYITVNEINEWKETLDDPKSVFISLIVWFKKDDKETRAEK